MSLATRRTNRIKIGEDLFRQFNQIEMAMRYRTDCAADFIRDGKGEQAIQTLAEMNERLHMTLRAIFIEVTEP